MMKTQRILNPVLLFVFLLGSAQIFAQVKSTTKENTPKRTPLMYLQLNETQQAQAKIFFTEMQKEMIPLRLDVQEKQVALEKLLIAKKPDKEEIFNQVDEIASIKVEIQKLRIANKLKLRNILNEDQRVRFDNRQTMIKKRKTKVGETAKSCNKSLKRV